MIEHVILLVDSTNTNAPPPEVFKRLVGGEVNFTVDVFSAMTTNTVLLKHGLDDVNEVVSKRLCRPAQKEQ